MNKDKVAIVRADNYNQSKAVIEKGCKLLGGLKIKPGEKIVIKPNLCSERSCKTGATTNLEFLRALIEYINNKLNGKCQIYIVESDAQGIDADVAFKRFNLLSLEESFSNLKLVNLSLDADLRITLDDGAAFDVLEVPQTLLHCTYFISLSKLKTHVDQRMSCAMKNQFGCITKKYKSIFHPFLSEAIYDVNNLYQPNLCIVDGIIGMEGFGPTDGSPKRSNLVIFGSNHIATDIVAARIMQLNPKDVPHLRFAMKRKKYSASDFTVIGEDPAKMSMAFEFTGEVPYYIARSGLRIQRWAQYLTWFGEYMQKVRSAIGLVGINTVTSKVCYSDMFRISKAMMFRFSR